MLQQFLNVCILVKLHYFHKKNKSNFKFLLLILVCKTCIAAYLDNDEEDNTRCPKCDSVIDHVNPWRVLVFDRTLQSIAYKLVPHLYKG